MITEHDLEEAIAECQGQRNPNASTCIKLAAFYTIREHLYPEVQPTYSYASEPPAEEEIEYNSGTDFANAIKGKKTADFLPVVDELMETLKVIYPRLYDTVMSRL